VEIELILEQVQSEPKIFKFKYSKMVNAGYVGRNQEEVRRHIDELAKKGIPGPKKTPTLYPVVCRTLVMDEEIEVYSGDTCGEVEYVMLIQDKDTIYVGLGSDHTDRRLEETDIARSKQICPNVLCRNVWLLSDVEDHWDELHLTSKTIRQGEEIPYQKGDLELIMNPRDLIKFVISKISEPLDGTVIYSGTIALSTTGFVFGERFVAELIDRRLNRRLDLAYDVNSLKYMPLEKE
jgi:hypothetical protein